MPSVQAARQFQTYRNPQQTARLFQAQLRHSRSYQAPYADGAVTVRVYSPALLIARGYVKSGNLPAPYGHKWFRFTAKVYKVSTYRLMMVTTFVGLPGPQVGYVDTSYPV